MAWKRSPELVPDLQLKEEERNEQFARADFEAAETQVRLLKKEGYIDKMKVRLSINIEGKHNERYWSDEFPKAIEWLYFSTKDE